MLNMNKNEKKQNRKVFSKKKQFKIIIIFFVSIFTFVLLTFGIPIIINEVYKSNSGYLTLWDASDVLSFYSVILSGIITIGSLIVTIYFSKKDTEKQIKHSHSQTNVPFFVIESVCSPCGPLRRNPPSCRKRHGQGVRPSC